MIIRRRPRLRQPLDSRGLVGWWPFYQGTIDESGHAARLGVVGGTATPNIGFPGPCYRFPNSATAIITCGPSDPLSANKVSVCCWFNPATTGRCDLVTSWFMGNTANDQFDLLYGLSAAFPQFFVSNNGSPISILAASAITVGAWSHIVGTYDGTTFNLYINGVLNATSTSAGTMGTGVSRNYIIGNNGAGDGTTNGSIADVRVYNRILSKAEVFAMWAEAYQTRAGIEEINLFPTAAAAPQGGLRRFNMPMPL